MKLESFNVIMRGRRIRARFAASFIAVLLLACGKPGPEDSGVAARPHPGTLISYAGSRGDVKQSEVIAVDGPYVTLGRIEDSAPKAAVTYYRGLFPVSGTVGSRSFSFRFDPAALERVFPVETGKSAKFRAEFRSSKMKTPRPANIVVAVRDAEDFRLQDRKVRAYRVDMTADIDVDGRPWRRTESALYAPALGMTVQEAWTDDGENVSYQMLTFDESGRAFSPSRTLGTTAI